MTRPTSTIDAFSPEAYADEAGIAARFAAMRAQGDVLWIEQEPYRPFWAVLRHKDIMEMENNIKQFQGNSQRALMEQRGRVRESILRDVRGVIEEKSKAGGYNTVLDISAQSANGTPVVIFTTLAGGESDLSDSVAKALAATAPPDSAKTDAPKTEAKDPKKADENKAEKK